MKRLLSIHIKLALSSEIYEKMLRISLSSISQTNKNVLSYGKILNLMQVDLECITSGVINFLSLLVLPFSFSIGFYLMFITIGWRSGLTGTGIIIILLALTVSLSKEIDFINKKLMEKKDERMKACTELLGNIRIFKIYN